MQVRRTVYPVKQFASWLKAKQLDLRPPFQRNDVWKPTSKSLLIDTVLRGLPLPIIILRDKAGITIEPDQEVVDGQQRLTTLLAFISPDLFPPKSQFTLKLKEIEADTFDKLDKAQQQAILDYELSVHILPSSVDDQQVLRIFARLNSTGLGLTPQELRNAEFQGIFKNFIFELSFEHLNDWQDLKLFTEDNFARMREVEFASELVMRMLRGTVASSKPVIDRLYKENEEAFPDEEVVKERFDAVLTELVNGLASAKNSIFHQVTWFYTLFGDIHDQMYGTIRHAKAPHLTKTKTTSISKAYWEKVHSFSARLKAGNIGTIEETKALSGRTTNLNTRQKREKWLKSYIDAT